jgi:hypothetical protein
MVFDDQNAFAAGRPPSIAVAERGLVPSFAAPRARFSWGSGA